MLTQQLQPLADGWCSGMFGNGKRERGAEQTPLSLPGGKETVKKLLLFALLATVAAAQTTRTATVSWGMVPGVNGYNVYRATSTSGPFTLLNTALVTATSYQDTTVVVGNTYTYEVTAVAAACTPTTPVTTPCGSSGMSAPATTTVPPPPGVTTTITVTVQ